MTVNRVCFSPRLLALVLCFFFPEVVGDESTPSHSWMEAIEKDEGTGHGLEFLQIKGSRKFRDCPLPDAESFISIGKGCPAPGQVEGIWGGSCLDKNTGYESLSEAWDRCAGVEDCGAVMQYDDQRFYLRRVSDPDMSADASKAKLYYYACEASPPSLDYNMLDRLIILPQYNLLFCYVEKVACTSFNDVFSQLRMRFDKTAVRTEGPEGWLQGSLYTLGIGKEQIEAMMVNKSWHKAIFYRDPVERFVSAFRSKCEGADGDGDYFCSQAFDSKYSTFHEAVDKLFAKRHEPWWNETVNEHFKRQSSFCGGLHNTIQYYDVVERLDVDTARDKTINLLNKIGADHRWIQDFDKMFPPPAAKQSTATFLDSDHATRASEHQEQYLPEANPDLLAELFIYYQDDYRLFNMRPPQWQLDRMTMFMDEAGPSS